MSYFFEDFFTFKGYNKVPKEIQFLGFKCTELTKRLDLYIILLLYIIVIGPGFKLMFPADIRINLKHELYLFKWILDRA